MQKNERKTEQAQKVLVEEDKIIVELADGHTSLSLKSLPQKYIDWIDNGRKGMYDKLLGRSETVRFFAQHLPVIVTYSENNIFPFNCSNKGIGFIPKEKYLSEFINLFHETIYNSRGKPWQQSIEDRVNAVSKFYFDHEKIDHRAITSLEIFEKNTFQNLNHTPLSSLLFTGDAPDYISFQLNCAVEVIGQDDPRHTFIMLARTMFEYDHFHIAQPQFPFAYIFWISEVMDKTPYRVREQPDKVQYIKTKGNLHWQPDAIQAVNRAPGMIRQFIREKIEDYAGKRGFTEINLELIREAKNALERKNDQPCRSESAIRPYIKICVALDNSELSNEAMHLSVKIGKQNKGELFGSHVYAAKLHDKRFRTMEGGLPEEYQKENVLGKQRKVHDSLITKGLGLITDSYLEVMTTLCRESDIPFTGISLEGRNFEELAKDINSHDYDLVVLGGHGIGRVTSSLLGTVTERVLRRVRRDILICKKKEEENQSDKIVVCLDGSSRSWGALKRGIQLAKAFQKKLIVISVFDPYFHYTMFNSLSNVLSDKARRVFKFEEQEKLHEDIIDSGLAKIYQAHLDIAKKIARDDEIEIDTRLLDGKAFEKILEFIDKVSPWLVVMGRIGIHSDDDMDIGGTTENICRLAPCNLIIADIEFKPPAEYQAEETITWTKEAKSEMSSVPPMAQGVAIKAIQNYCIAQGHTVVTSSVLNAAIKDLLAPETIEKMGITFDDPEKFHDKIKLSFRCQACGYVHHGIRPQKCPICGKEGNMFKIIESKTVEDGVALETLSDRKLIWEKSAIDALNKIKDKVLRRQIKTKLEKMALTQRLSAISLEMVEGYTKPYSEILYSIAESGLTWSDDAIKRMERIPEGFMRKVSKKTIEEYAKENGITEITLEVTESGLGKARKKMVESVQSNKRSLPETTVSGSFECNMCGYIEDGSKPDQCPACQVGKFTKLTEEERKKATKTATMILEWDQEALKRIEEVPAGFIRTMTRCRTEQWARRKSHKRVTMEVIEEKYASWKEGSTGLESELEWSEEAKLRINKIPQFIRPMVIKEIEKKAKSLDKTFVDSDILKIVIEGWHKNFGSFHK